MNNRYLYHWESDIKFKYVAKVKEGKKTKYFYTNAAYQAYLKAKKKAQETATKAPASPLVNLFNKAKSKQSNVLSNLYSKKVPAAETTEKSATSILKEPQKKKAESVLSTISKNLSKAVSKIDKKKVDSGKKITEEKLGAVFLIPVPQFIHNLADAIKDLFKTKDGKKNEKKDLTEAKTRHGKESPSSLKEMKKQTETLTNDENQAAVNPLYNTGVDDYGYANNCAHCTAAYDLRRRGYDVEATPMDPNDPNTIVTIAEWYENTDYKDWNTNSLKSSKNYHEMHEKTKKELLKEPDGSYGHFSVYWSVGGGHSMVWEKSGNDVVIRDCQINETYTYDEWVKKYGSMTTATMTMRTDNRKPSNKILKTVRNK